MTTTRVAPPFRANQKQADLHRHWHDPAARIVLIAGAIRAGKTQGAGRLLVETAIEQPALYLVARSTYRELEDSTKRAILHGDGDLPPLLPYEVRARNGYRASDNKVVLANGSEILFRSLEEGQVGKILNLTLGGIFVDQIEELDPGEAGERLFDTLLGRLSHPSGPRKLVAVANPAARMHWVHRRFVDEKTRDADSRYIHVTMRDNAQHLPPGYVEQQEATRESRPAWYRTFVLGEWGAFEGAAYPQFSEQTHVVDAFDIPEGWPRFENMDFGVNHATAWYVNAVDYDGNIVTFDEYHEPNLPSVTAPEILKRRAWWHPPGENPTAFADPSVFSSAGVTNRWGAPATVASEFAEHGINLARGNNDRVAGHVRIAEIVEPDKDRRFPAYHPLGSNLEAPELGSPRWFIFRRCTHLIEQMQAAPIEEEGEPHPGEAVSRRWEGPYGHGHASSRYGMLTWPRPSAKPPEPVTDPRRALLDEISKRENDKRQRRYSNV